MAKQVIITFPPVIDDETVMPVVCCDFDAPLPLCPAGAGYHGVHSGVLSSIFTLLDE